MTMTELRDNETLVQVLGSVELRRKFLSNILIVPSEPCWYWTASFMGGVGSYGRFCVRRGAYVAAHRIMLAAKLGRELVAGEMACHTCDFRSCVNPDHLWLGDAGSNARDMHRKGRAARNGNKLSPAQVLEIRNKLRLGYGPTELSRLFGVVPSTIVHIKYGRTWCADDD